MSSCPRRAASSRRLTRLISSELSELMMFGLMNDSCYSSARPAGAIMNPEFIKNLEVDDGDGYDLRVPLPASLLSFQSGEAVLVGHVSDLFNPQQFVGH